MWNYDYSMYKVSTNEQEKIPYVDSSKSAYRPSLYIICSQSSCWTRISSTWNRLYIKGQTKREKKKKNSRGNKFLLLMHIQNKILGVFLAIIEMPFPGRFTSISKSLLAAFLSLYMHVYILFLTWRPRPFS